MMTADAVRELVEPILRDRLGQFGFTHADVSRETAFDDELVWRIDVFYGDGGAQPGGEATIDARVAIRQTLLEQGEDVLPLLRHRFSSDQAAA